MKSGVITWSVVWISVFVAAFGCSSSEPENDAPEQAASTSEQQTAKIETGLKKDLPPNEKLQSLLTAPFGEGSNLLDVIQRGTDIEEAVRPDSEQDFMVLRIVLLMGSGQTISFGPGAEGIDPICYAASSAMKKFGQPVVPVLISDLQNEDELCRFWTAVALEEFGADGEAALPALREALTDPSDKVQRAAKSAIEAIENPSTP